MEFDRLALDAGHAIRETCRRVVGRLRNGAEKTAGFRTDAGGEAVAEVVDLLGEAEQIAAQTVLDGRDLEADRIDRAARAFGHRRLDRPQRLVDPRVECAEALAEARREPRVELREPFVDGSGGHAHRRVERGNRQFELRLLGIDSLFGTEELGREGGLEGFDAPGHLFNGVVHRQYVAGDRGDRVGRDLGRLRPGVREADDDLRQRAQRTTDLVQLGGHAHDQHDRGRRHDENGERQDGGLVDRQVRDSDAPADRRARDEPGEGEEHGGRC